MSLRHLPYRVLLVLFVSIVRLPQLAAQNAQLAVPAASAPTASFQARFDEAWALAPMADQGATVQNFVLTREQASIELTDGRLALLAPIDGKAVGAVWEGTGRFHMTVDQPGEQLRLKRFFGNTSLDIPINSVVFFFSDSTGAERHVAAQAEHDRRVGGHAAQRAGSARLRGRQGHSRAQHRDDGIDAAEQLERRVLRAHDQAERRPLDAHGEPERARRGAPHEPGEEHRMDAPAGGRGAAPACRRGELSARRGPDQRRGGAALQGGNDAAQLIHR